MQDENGRAIDRRAMLRVKIKSLAEEARIIRREEKRARPSASEVYGLREELHGHRTGVVRSEARVALLAYGIIRGRAIDRMEPRAHTQPDWKRVRELVKRYGPADRARNVELLDSLEALPLAA